MATRIRVLVVDDSAFARKVLGDTLRGDARFEVIGIAHDGLEALEKIAELKPDVVTLDLVMPNLDGLGVLRALPPRDRSRVVVVSMNDADSELGVAALREGAFDLIHKPTAIATDRLYGLADELREKVAMAGAVNPLPVLETVPPPTTTSALAATSLALIVIGASTGGPQALTRLLRALPANFPVPIAIVLHIPPGYTAAFAARLDEECEIKVVEAKDGLALEAGVAIVAQAGVHLKIASRPNGLCCVLDSLPDGPHVPSVDELFVSAAATVGTGALGVVLTGMGDDGVRGARALHAKGAAILTEAESTCVVYGMPRSVVEAGLSTAAVPLPQMANAILRRL